MMSSGPKTTTAGWDNPAGRNLSVAEKDQIRKLIGAGYSHREIGIRMDRGRATISRAARAMGINPAQAKKPWTAQEDAQLIRLLNQGQSQRQIAKALGRHHPAISYRLWFLRSRQEGGAEIRYQPPPKAPAPAKAAPVQTGRSTQAVAEVRGAIGLLASPDLWAIWHRRVFGLATPA